MAARRLVIVMLILLGVSTLAAALAPAPGERAESTTSTTSSTPQATTLTPTGGALVRETIDAQARRPRRIRIELGDQLALEVRSPKVAQVEIPRLGLTEDAAPLSPARFDVFADREGRFEVRLQGSRRGIAEVEVRAG